MNFYLICGVLLIYLLRLTTLHSDLSIPLNLTLVIGLVLYNVGRFAYAFWRDGLSVDSFDKVLRSSIGEKGVEFVVFERMVFKAFLVFCWLLPDSTPFPNLRHLVLPRNLGFFLIFFTGFLTVLSMTSHFLIEQTFERNTYFHLGLVLLETYIFVWLVGVYQLDRLKKRSLAQVIK